MRRFLKNRDYAPEGFLLKILLVKRRMVYFRMSSGVIKLKKGLYHHV